MILGGIHFFLDPELLEHLKHTDVGFWIFWDLHLYSKSYSKLDTPQKTQKIDPNSTNSGPKMIPLMVLIVSMGTISNMSRMVITSFFFGFWAPLVCQKSLEMVDSEREKRWNSWKFDTKTGLTFFLKKNFGRNFLENV